MNGMMLKMGTSALKTKMQEKEMDIEWEDYNYPPGLKIIHYNPPEMVDPTKVTLAKLMHASFLLLVVFYFLNFTINLLAWIAGDQSIGFFMPLYSIFHMFMIVPLGMGVFSKGYRAMAGISSERTWYKYGEVFLLVMCILIFFFHILCYHGLKIVREFKTDGMHVLILGIIEQVCLAANAGIRGYSLYMVLLKYCPSEDAEEKKEEGS
jgi:hypothetical protein